MEFVAEDRRTESLAAYYAQLTDAQKTALQAVAMDMWEPYIGATRDGLPDGERKIVFDRFHIMREMTKAVDTVRKQEHRAFLRDGEDSPLTGTKYLWLFSDERRPDRHADSFATLQALNLKVGRAWAIKEALRTLWTYRQGAAVGRFFSQWYGWAVRSRLEPVKKVAGMLKRHLDGVLRFAKHPITNGVAEGLNSKIMSIKRKAGGFRNPSNFTTAIYFHCGGLDLYPQITLPFWLPMHPGGRRCSSLTYAGYARSSRLGRRAPRHPTWHISSRGLKKWYIRKGGLGFLFILAEHG